MISDSLLIIAGFFLLILGSDKFIIGAVAIANHFRISERWVGLTLIAFGTSLPELVVTGYAASHGSPDVALSNVLGSNVANAWLALGLCALCASAGIKRFQLNAEFWLTPLFVSILYGLLLFYSPPVVIHRSIPFTFLIVTTVFLLFFSGRKDVRDPSEEHHIQLEGWKTAGYLTVGLIGLLIGSKWIVDGVVHFSDYFGWSQSLLGYSVVAVGTSLPEIASSVAATIKGKHEMAIANVLGSNLINIGIVYGMTCFFNPIIIPQSASPIFIAALLSTVTAPLYLYSKSAIRNKTIGIAFVVAYFICLGFVAQA